MPNKSLYKQITQPRETYTDGYGTTREVWEPEAVTAARKVYTAAKKFFNGPDNVMGGAGALEFVNPTIALGPLATITSKINKAKQAQQNALQVMYESKMLRSPNPSYLRSYMDDVSKHDNDLAYSYEKLRPYVEDGTLKEIFQTQDWPSLKRILWNSDQRLLRDLKTEFGSRYIELQETSSKRDAFTQAWKELREQLGKLYKYNK